MLFGSTRCGSVFKRVLFHIFLFEGVCFTFRLSGLCFLLLEVVKACSVLFHATVVVVLFPVILVSIIWFLLPGLFPISYGCYLVSASWFVPYFLCGS